jgi:hypothetical protein
VRTLKITLSDGRTITVLPPTVRQYYIDRTSLADNDMAVFRFMAEVYSRNEEGIIFTADDVLDTFTTDDFSFFWDDFLDWVKQEKNENPN